MSTERKSIDFLEGHGLNLAVPIHKDPTRALVMENWRPDRMVGRLRSRLANGAVVDNYPATIDTIWLENGSNRYIGAGTALYRNTVSIVTGLDGDRLFLASGRGFTWIMNRGAQKKDNGSTVTDWGVPTPASAPTAAVGAAGVITGDVQYMVSYEDSAGFEGAIGDLSAVVTLAAEQADLTSIPVGPAGVTKRFIYRIGGGLTQAYRVATIADNVTTTYTDNELNESAIQLGITAPIDRDPPPEARGVCHYGGRLVAWSTAAYPNRIYWSGIDGFWYFPTDNYLPVGDSGEQILACAEVRGALAILKERSLWAFYGSLDDGSGSLECVSTEFGATGTRGINIGKEIIRYASRKGIFKFSGDGPIKLSTALDPIFNGEAVPVGSGNVLPAINLQHLSKVVIESSDNLLYVSYPGGASTTNSRTAVLNMTNGEWMADSRGFTALHQEGPLGAFSAAIGDDHFYMDNGQTDDGVDITVTYQHSFSNFGAPDNDKQVLEVLVEHALGSEVLSVKVFYNRDVVTAPTTLGTITGSGITRFVLNGDEGVMVDTMSVLVEGVVNAEVEVTRIQSSYILHPRLTKRWVSDVLSGMQEKMLECRAIQMELDAGTANFDLVLASDGLGAGDIAAQDTVTKTVAGTPGRRPYRETLATSKFGRLWRTSANSTTELRVYRSMIEVREIPIYLNGPRGDSFEEQPITLGV